MRLKHHVPGSQSYFHTGCGPCTIWLLDSIVGVVCGVQYGLLNGLLMCGSAVPGENPENDAVRIMKLLKDGAHAFAKDGAAVDAREGEEKGMAQEDIEQVGNRQQQQISLACCGADISWPLGGTLGDQ